jgi:hypothetical protein
VFLVCHAQRPQSNHLFANLDFPHPVFGQGKTAISCLRIPERLRSDATFTTLDHDVGRVIFSGGRDWV